MKSGELGRQKMVWIYIFSGIAANSAASIFLKKASDRIGSLQSFTDYIQLLINPFLLLGLVAYGLAFVFYAVALSVAPLSLVQPVMTAGAIVLISLSASLFFKEQLSWVTIIGIFVTIVGVTLISMGASNR